MFLPVQETYFGTGERMASWVLLCSRCELTFTHSAIADDGSAAYMFREPLKPQLEPDKTQFKCPHCGQYGVYKRSDLRHVA
jgi:hypothetical protein